ncbi:hypothetical protein MTP99_012895 [Tenebrio molitor]|nr:hypothetical protein MTP99_012895 [Tenebrio molitor]
MGTMEILFLWYQKLCPGGITPSVASRLNLGGFDASSNCNYPYQMSAPPYSFSKSPMRKNDFPKCALDAINSTATQASASLPFCFLPKIVDLLLTG